MSKKVKSSLKIWSFTAVWFSGLSVLCLTLLITSCQGPEKGTGKEGSLATSEQEKSGNQLWSENCQRCHNVISPSAYNDAQWEVVLHHMRVRANLTAVEAKKILEFMKASNK